MLARCNFSAIKLDKSLIDQIGPERPAPAWLETVKVLLESSPLQVIAEGVETEYQFAVLSAAKVQAAQGFYFSRPLPVAEFLAFHRDYGCRAEPATHLTAAGASKCVSPRLISS